MAECGSNPENRSCNLDTYSTKGCRSQRGLFAVSHLTFSLQHQSSPWGNMVSWASVQPCRRENRPGKAFGFKQPSKLDPRSSCWTSSCVIKYCLCSWLWPQCRGAEKHRTSRAWEGIRSWTASELMHRSSVSAASRYRAKPSCPQKKEMLPQQCKWRWKARWWRVGRIRERRVKLSKQHLCNVFVCAAMYPLGLYSLLRWGGLAEVWWQGCKWVCSSPHADRTAREKDTARNSSSKEQNSLNDSFAHLRTVRKT